MIGFLLCKRASGSLEHYFLAGRKLPWYFLGFSGMASWFDVTGTMIITSFLFLLGPRGLFIEFRGGAVLILVFLLAFTGKWHRRSGCMTAAEWMQFRFGNGKDADAARLLTAIVAVLPILGMIGYMVKGTGLFLSMFFPFEPNTCAAALLAIAVLYTMMSGFYGVVISDVLQATLVFVAAVVLGIVAFNIIPNAGMVANMAENVTGNPNWTTTHPTLYAEMPSGSEYDVYRNLGMAAFFYLVVQMIVGGASGADPRYFAARSDRDCGKLNILISWMIAIRWPMMMGLAVLGLFLAHQTFSDMQMVGATSELIHSHFPELAKSDWHQLTTRLITHPDSFDPTLIQGLTSTLGAEWANKLPMIGYEGIVDPERILPAVILDLVPIGLRGIILITIFAATMSTFDSTLNAGSAFIVRDIYQRWLRKSASKRELIAASWTTTVVFALIGFFVGINFNSINEIWDWIIMSLTTGLFVPGLLRLYWWRMNGWGIAFGLGAGGITAISQRILLPDIAPWWKFLLVASIAFAATILGCLATKPTNRDTLIDFYKRTRPFGIWGPVRKWLKQEQRDYIWEENKRDLISLPFAFVYLVTLYMIPMQLIIHRFDSIIWTLPQFILSCLVLYFVWWKNQRPDRQMELEPDLRDSSSQSDHNT
jgi:Na+/proline symporter